MAQKFLSNLCDTLSYMVSLGLWRQWELSDGTQMEVHEREHLPAFGSAILVGIYTPWQLAERIKAGKEASDG